jgi:UDP-N-acetylmuramate: L-alanyl-gamma-D-glutamyl-meso-diaminopimelate ligase
MHIHILGICGTFMGGLAILAKQAGHRVTGCDQHVYPPMSTQLESLGIELVQGYDPAQLEPRPDLVVIGNAMSRGNPCVEYVLEHGLPYTSGPQWLRESVLAGRWVIGVAGTHGKTTTASMLAWILESAGMAPGFLIGGVPQNFGVSARLGDTPFFVVEADEYDSAFFDKRSKFVHYQPRTLILNNLEFDHADIFDDLKAIQRQFNHLLRTVPASGRVIAPSQDKAITEVLNQGCWSETELVGEGAWQWQPLTADCSEFEVYFQGELLGCVKWRLIGAHNAANATMAIAAARHVGVMPALAIESLADFVPPKRRMEVLCETGGVTVYDDFAHHPTAIQTTLAGLRAKVGAAPIVAVLEPRSNTMKMGVHQGALVQSLADADQTYIYQGAGVQWQTAELFAGYANVGHFDSIDELVSQLVAGADVGQHIVVMSNGGFGGLHQKLIKGLEARFKR